MKFAATAGALLLASTALALPSREAIEQMAERRHERMRKRVAAGRRTRGNPPLNKSASTDTTEVHGPVKHVSYDSNWAGVVQIGSGITEVSGTFNNPAVTSGSGASQYGAAYWVGIDGDTCQSAILQTGVSGTIENGQPQYAAWYEWYPDYSYTFSGFEVNPGDQITASVQSSGTNSGTATVENLTTGKSVTHSFTSQQGNLCGTNAEWIVEDFESGGSLIGFANFGEVDFTDATYNGGNLNGGNILDVQQNGQTYTQTTVTGDTSFNTKYVGP